MSSISNQNQSDESLTPSSIEVRVAVEDDGRIPAWMVWTFVLMLIGLIYLWRPTYSAHLLVMAGIYLLLSTSLNLVAGFGGLISFCHAAFYGIGAYTYAVLRLQSGSAGDQANEMIWAAGWSFIPALVAATLAGGVTGWLVAMVTLRFRGDYFVFATLGIQMIVFAVLYNWMELARGPYGIYGIARPDLFGWRPRQPWEYMLLLVPMVFFATGLMYWVYQSMFGLKLKTIREDERAALSIGVETNVIARRAMAISAAFAAFAGALYASYVTYIDPTSFSLSESIFLVAMLMLGGGGNLTGPVIGTLIMISLPEILRFVGLPDAVAANMREFIYGGMLAALMYWRPQGIAGERLVDA